MRRRYVYDPEAPRPDGGKGTMVEVVLNYQQETPAGPYVRGDLPGYMSHSGQYVEGARQRREDLKRMGCRPWEGMDQETKEAQRHAAYEEAKSDRRLDEHARRAYYQLSPEKRRLLERG